MLRLLALLLAPAVAAAADRKPNVVLILADDLGARDLGCYGSTYHKTPHIDALAKQGVKLDQAYAACHVCSPTRAALLTGKHPARLGITDWIPGRPNRPDQKLNRPEMRNELPLEEVTLAEVLKQHGYATACIGKWHLGGASFEPTKQGFDVAVAGDSWGQPPTYFAPYTFKGRSIPGLENAPDGEYLTDRLTAEAEKFITANKERPFFLYLSHFAVHTPLQAKKDVVAKYKQGPPGKQGNPTYAAMLESLDDSVGRIMKQLDDLKLAENTIVIFTSDNGGLVCSDGNNTQMPTVNSPLRDGKGTLYEGGLRVPFIIRGPGVQGGDADPVSSADVMPTLLGLCGIATDLRFDGMAIHLENGRDSILEIRAHYWHYPHYSNHFGRPGGAIRFGIHKLIEHYENGRLELFDLAKDPGESRNLAETEPEKTKELAKELAEWRARIGAKMPTPNPDYKPNPQAADGSITMLGKYAEVHGIQLRFEPLPHKNTLGFWTRKDDYATFEFTVDTPGKFTVEVLQGCGKGSGGAEVEVGVGQSKCKFTVEDTGGFQNFKAREVGEVTVDKAGRHTLAVKPLTKPGAAVMDLRQVVLKPAK